MSLCVLLFLLFSLSVCYISLSIISVSILFSLFSVGDEELDDGGLGETPPWWFSLLLWSITACLLASPLTLGIHWAVYYILAAPSHGLGKTDGEIDRTAAGACLHHIGLFFKKLTKPCWKREKKRFVRRVSDVELSKVR